MTFYVASDEGRKITRPRLASVLIALALLAVAGLGGYPVGRSISKWASRLHPHPYWTDWSVGTKTNAQLVLDRDPENPRIVSLKGHAVQNEVWDNSFNYDKLAVVPNAPHQLYVRIKSATDYPVFVTLLRRKDPWPTIGLNRGFTPTREFADYVFDFKTASDVSLAGLTFFVGSPNIDLKIERAEVKAVSAPKPKQEAGVNSIPVSAQNCTLSTYVSLGQKLTLPADSKGEAVFSRWPDPKQNANMQMEIALPVYPAGNSAVLSLRVSGDQPISGNFICTASDEANRRITLGATPFELSTTPKTFLVPLASSGSQVTSIVAVEIKEPKYSIRVGEMSVRWTEKAKLKPGQLDVAAFALAVNGSKADRKLASIHPDGPLRIEKITASPKEDWRVSLNHPIELEKNKEYKLEFEARADSSRSIRVCFSMNHPPWHIIGKDLLCNLTKEWKKFSFAIKPSESDPKSRISICMGDQAPSVEIRSIQLTKK